MLTITGRQLSVLLHLNCFNA